MSFSTPSEGIKSNALLADIMKQKEEEEELNEFENSENRIDINEFCYFSDYTDCLLNYGLYVNDDIDGKIGNFLPITLIQRTTVVQWLSELCDIYLLSLDTFSLSVYIFDKYLYISNFSQKPLISQIQLIGSCCLLIAAKYEEGHYPAISELVFMCDGLYNKNNFLKMQNLILTTLHYRITRPDARFIARLKLYKMETFENVDIDDNFFDSVDFVFKSTLFSPFLTFAPLSEFADTLIDTTCESEIVDQSQESDIKLYVVESLKIAQDAQESC